MHPSIGFHRLIVALTVAGLTACGSGSAPIVTTPTLPTLTEQPATPSALPSTPRPAASATHPRASTPDQNRVAATIQVASPSSMAVGDGLIWVIAGGSVVRIDPKTNQVVRKSIPAGAQPEAIALGGG